MRQSVGQKSVVCLLHQSQAAHLFQPAITDTTRRWSWLSFAGRCPSCQIYDRRHQSLGLPTLVLGYDVHKSDSRPEDTDTPKHFWSCQLLSVQHWAPRLFLPLFPASCPISCTTWQLEVSISLLTVLPQPWDLTSCILQSLEEDSGASLSVCVCVCPLYIKGIYHKSCSRRGLSMWIHKSYVNYSSRINSDDHYLLLLFRGWD